MRTKQRTILSPQFFLSLILSAGVCLHVTMASAGFTIRDTRPVSVGGAPGQGEFLAFEANTPFWTADDADPLTEVARVNEPGSVNGDAQAWRVTLTDALDGRRRFSLVNWALQHLDVTSATYLVLYVHGTVGGETFEVGLTDFAVPGHEIRKNVDPFIVGGGPITTSYKKIRIPLTEFSAGGGGVVLSNLDTFKVISTAPNGQNITIYIDAMGFE